ncbi:hypothetical protein WJX73_010010 [Symbiochloris irregularis]|uniref:Dipeptidylpeptidase IV N-terminal domain-containing protein n=1 Tax=Symbiochloris irregularis TaxID=706552 RepID=A0AAW1NUD6_9CHLO
MLWHTLPKLGAKDLGPFASPCRAGRNLVAQVGIKQWQEVAKSLLPPGHPVHNSHQVSAIRSALTSFAASQANLSKGQVSCQVHVPCVLGNPRFSPKNGRDFAALVHERATLPDEDGNMFPGEFNLYYLIVFHEDGTRQHILSWEGCKQCTTDYCWAPDGEHIVFMDLDHDEEAPCLNIVKRHVEDGADGETSKTASIQLDQHVAAHVHFAALSPSGDCLAVNVDSPHPTNRWLIYSVAGHLLKIIDSSLLGSNIQRLGF